MKTKRVKIKAKATKKTKNPKTPVNLIKAQKKKNPKTHTHLKKRNKMTA